MPRTLRLSLLIPPAAVLAAGLGVLAFDPERLRGLAAMTGAVLLALGLMWNALRINARPIAGLRKRLAAADAERNGALAEIAAQDAARREAAIAILQDEAAPALFAIRAEVGGLSRMARGNDPATEEARRRLTEISGSVTQLQRIHAKLLDGVKSDPPAA